MMAVSDSGEGMPPEVQQRMFEPFYTTKGAGKGTGLGLHTVHGIVKQSGGSIEVYSEIGLGTTMKVYLPRVETPAEDMTGKPKPVETLNGDETVLVVEDDEMVRGLTVRLLKKFGYTVLEARHGREALALAERHGGHIDLLMTDVVMPHGSGGELAERFREAHPTTRVLYVSGYTDDAIVHHGVNDVGQPFLQKPFTPQALGRKIRDVLETP
jgi:CheY-like chemotaxis protein